MHQRRKKQQQTKSNKQQRPERGKTNKTTEKERNTEKDSKKERKRKKQQKQNTGNAGPAGEGRPPPAKLSAASPGGWSLLPVPETDHRTGRIEKRSRQAAAHNNEKQPIKQGAGSGTKPKQEKN